MNKKSVWLGIVVLLSAVAGSALAGAGTGKADEGGDGADASTSASSGPKQGGTAVGFSIESEMLTYRALQSNSEAIACDVAGYVNGAAPTFSSNAPGATCNVQPRAGAAPGVVLGSFDQTVFEGFQFWRAEMEVMREIHARAHPYCTGSGVVSVESRGSAVAGVAKSAASLTPVGAALQLSQALVGMLKSVPSSAPVMGTIQDQAFIDGVGRALRALNVTVIAPTVFSPFGLAPMDVSHSPFLSGMNRLLDERTCLEDRDAATDLAPADKLRVHETIAEIDAYLAVFRAIPATQSIGGESPNPAGRDASRRAAGGAGNQGESTPLVSDVAPLMAMLAGDNLARKLGVDPTSGLLPASSVWEHVLLVKALESGGTIAGKSNIFGSNTRYSGGSVGTYALFSLDGSLECSGNVYEFGGSVSAETFEKDLRGFKPDPQSQLLFQRGGCLNGPAHQ